MFPLSQLHGPTCAKPCPMQSPSYLLLKNFVKSMRPSALQMAIPILNIKYIICIVLQTETEEKAAVCVRCSKLAKTCIIFL